MTQEQSKQVADYGENNVPEKEVQHEFNKRNSSRFLKML